MRIIRMCVHLGLNLAHVGFGGAFTYGHVRSRLGARRLATVELLEALVRAHVVMHHSYGVRHERPGSMASQVRYLTYTLLACISPPYIFLVRVSGPEICTGTMYWRTRSVPLGCM